MEEKILVLRIVRKENGRKKGEKGGIPRWLRILCCVFSCLNKNSLASLVRYERNCAEASSDLSTFRCREQKSLIDEQGLSGSQSSPV